MRKAWRPPMRDNVSTTQPDAADALNPCKRLLFLRRVAIQCIPMQVDMEIDLSGLRCPLPVLRTKKALSQLSAGALLCVLTTDEDSLQDIPAFVQQSGHRLEETKSADGKHYFYIRKQ